MEGTGQGRLQGPARGLTGTETHPATGGLPHSSPRLRPRVWAGVCSRSRLPRAGLERRLRKRGQVQAPAVAGLDSLCQLSAARERLRDAVKEKTPLKRQAAKLLASGQRNTAPAALRGQRINGQRSPKRAGGGGGRSALASPQEGAAARTSLRLLPSPEPPRRCRAPSPCVLPQLTAPHRGRPRLAPHGPGLAAEPRNRRVPGGSPESPTQSSEPPPAPPPTPGPAPPRSPLGAAAAPGSDCGGGGGEEPRPRPRPGERSPGRGEPGLRPAPRNTRGSRTAINYVYCSRPGGPSTGRGAATSPADPSPKAAGWWRWHRRAPSTVAASPPLAAEPEQFTNRPASTPSFLSFVNLLS